MFSRMTALAPALFLFACGGPAAPSSQLPGEADSGPGQTWLHGQKPPPGGDVQGTRNFAFLVNEYASGRPANRPWAGAWWAFSSGSDVYGIANGKYGGGFSPAGKYDAVRGLSGERSAQDWEARYHGPDPLPGGLPPEGWWGHCNGWAAAASLFPEPRVPVRVNGLEFSPGEIKALLSEAAMVIKADFFGNRTELWHPVGSSAHADVAPAQLFLVLTNYMGIQRLGVNIDESTGSQVWNQPLAGYEVAYPTRDRDRGFVAGKGHVIEVNLRIWWMRDNVHPEHLTEPFDFRSAGNGSVDSREFRMELWLDGPIVWSGERVASSGDVIALRKDDGPQGESVYVGGQYLAVREEWSGAWQSVSPESCWGHCWPDFLWVPHEVIPPWQHEEYGIKLGDVNPHVEIDWVREFLLAPGDKIDPAGVAQPRPRPAPTGKPTPQSSSSPPPPTGL